MSERETDLQMLNELLDKHIEELAEREAEAFADMRWDLTAYAGTSNHHEQLTPAQRQWVTVAHERLVPKYANLVSRGLVPRGTPTAESRALDAMLAAPKVLRPPPRKQPCEQCGNPNAEFGPDPYLEEIKDNKTPRWLCAGCRRQNLRDI